MIWPSAQTRAASISAAAVTTRIGRHGTGNASDTRSSRTRTNRTSYYLWYRRVGEGHVVTVTDDLGAPLPAGEPKTHADVPGRASAPLDVQPVDRAGGRAGLIGEAIVGGQPEIG